jgi:hypothetical protein
MTANLAPIYDDGELTLYEVKAPLQLPLRAPSQAQRQALRQARVDPFESYPWIEANDLQVQITWTLTNLDAGAHHVELLIDPWNEFGKYWPGLQVVDADDGELLPNLSGIDELFLLPGTDEGSRSRIYGTYTFDDIEELAIDFATVIQIIQSFMGQVPADLESDPRVTYANHAFSLGNRSYNSPLVAPYRPGVIPGIVGFDFGLRTQEPANIALEVAVEIVDKTGGDRLIQNTADDEPLREPQQFYTVGQ